MPTKADLLEIAAVRRDLETLPQILSLPRQEVRQRVSPFLNALLSYASAVPPDTDVDELIGQKKPARSTISALLKWSANQVHLKRIKVISDIVSRYNEHRSDVMNPLDNYIELIEGFLKDSGKTVRFGDRGYLYVDIERVDGEKEISSLSSGEAQIFVILTHLVFNKQAQKNVFIIDEPELSLHVKWQEIFVDSVITANPNIQYVMATHSPSIIIDKVKNCINLSHRRRRRRKTALK